MFGEKQTQKMNPSTHAHRNFLASLLLLAALLGPPSARSLSLGRRRSGGGSEEERGADDGAPKPHQCRVTLLSPDGGRNEVDVGASFASSFERGFCPRIGVGV